jgi:anti-sigma B factor antagonist
MQGVDGPHDQLSIQLEVAPDWVVLRVYGELDVASAPLLRADLDLAELMHTPPRIAVECSEVSFCDSSGLGLLAGAWNRLRRAGGDLVLVRPQAQMLRRLRWTGLAERLTIRWALPGEGAW